MPGQTGPSLLGTRNITVSAPSVLPRGTLHIPTTVTFTLSFDRQPCAVSVALVLSAAISAAPIVYADLQFMAVLMALM